MGYARYEIVRNGQRIEAGYAVEAECDKTGCTERIDRGLAYLCGETPGWVFRGERLAEQLTAAVPAVPAVRIPHQRAA